MRRHQLQHPDERISCPKCHYRCSTHSLVLRHITKKHSPSNASRTMYPCPKCPFIGPSAKRLSVHMQFHDASLKFQCKQCSYSINRINLILQHRKLHVQTGHSWPITSKQACQQCPYKTADMSSFAAHARGHRTSRLRKCSFCCCECRFMTNSKLVFLKPCRLHPIWSPLTDKN